jgi:hypothetical protein
MSMWDNMWHSLNHYEQDQNNMMPKMYELEMPKLYFYQACNWHS